MGNGFSVVFGMWISERHVLHDGACLGHRTDNNNRPFNHSYVAIEVHFVVVLV